MMGKLLILTNNPMVRAEIQSSRWVEGSSADVAKEARDLVHRGSRFQSHPLAGSIRLLRNPYRTMFLVKGYGTPSHDHVRMAEDALRRLEGEDPGGICEADRKDYSLIDLDLARRSLGSQE